MVPEAENIREGCRWRSAHVNVKVISRRRLQLFAKWLTIEFLYFASLSALKSGVAMVFIVCGTCFVGSACGAFAGISRANIALSTEENHIMAFIQSLIVLATTFAYVADALFLVVNDSTSGASIGKVEAVRE